jgi:hypothetical protein
MVIMGVVKLVDIRTLFCPTKLRSWPSQGVTKGYGRPPATGVHDCQFGDQDHTKYNDNATMLTAERCCNSVNIPSLGGALAI